MFSCLIWKTTGPDPAYPFCRDLDLLGHNCLVRELRELVLKFVTWMEVVISTTILPKFQAKSGSRNKRKSDQSVACSHNVFSRSCERVLKLFDQINNYDNMKLIIILG